MSSANTDNRLLIRIGGEAGQSLETVGQMLTTIQRGDRSAGRNTPGCGAWFVCSSCPYPSLRHARMKLHVVAASSVSMGTTLKPCDLR
jgi:hypothetical protein